jgi:hypothetical protein
MLGTAPGRPPPVTISSLILTRLRATLPPSNFTTHRLPYTAGFQNRIPPSRMLATRPHGALPVSNPSLLFDPLAVRQLLSASCPFFDPFFDLLLYHQRSSSNVLVNFTLPLLALFDFCARRGRVLPASAGHSVLSSQLLPVLYTLRRPSLH